MKATGFLSTVILTLVVIGLMLVLNSCGKPSEDKVIPPCQTPNHLESLTIGSRFTPKCLNGEAGHPNCSVANHSDSKDYVLSQYDFSDNTWCYYYAISVDSENKITYMRQY